MPISSARQRAARYRRAGHGFMRDRQSLGALASELADRGALVVVPDLPFLADPVGNASALSAIVIDVRSGRFGPVPRAPS